MISDGIQKISIDDAKLVTDIRQKDNNALEQVMDMYSNTLIRMAYLILNDFSLAEDVTQETFIKFYYNIGQYRSEASIKTYLCSILINECRQKLRKNWFKKVFTTNKLDQISRSMDYSTRNSNEGGSITEPSFYNFAESSVESSVECIAEKITLKDTVLKLDIKYREVILLYYYYDMPVKEIAKVLGQAEGTVKSKLKRARDQLKNMLREEDFLNGDE